MLGPSPFPSTRVAGRHFSIAACTLWFPAPTTTFLFFFREVPRQQNDYDCGLFVLFFMERFIEEAPPRLRETDLDRFGRKWFQPAEASHLRDSIRILLEKYFKEAEKSIQDTMDDDSLPVVLEDLE